MHYIRRPSRSILPLEAVALQQDKLTNELDDLIRANVDVRPVLERLVQEHGMETATQVARIVFGSWRSRIDLVEEALNELLADQGRTDLL